MTGIKLTPLLLFVLLLIVLVISVVFGKMNNMEGFVAFQKDIVTPLAQVWIPQYSAEAVTVYKLNDNMFFDKRNGNFIEIDAEEFSTDINRLNVLMLAAKKQLDDAKIAESKAATELSNATEPNKTSKQEALTAAQRAVTRLTTLYTKAKTEYVSAGGPDPDGTSDASGNGTSGFTTMEGLTSRIDSTGVTITGLYITKRDGEKTAKYNATNTDNLNTLESKITGVISSYNTWSYPSQCRNTTPKEVIYLAWNQTTYIVIIDKVNTTRSYTITMINSTTAKTKEFINVAYQIGDNTNLGTDVNTVMKVPDYKNELIYMLHQNIGYDIKRGNVYIKPGNGINSRVLDRAGVEIADIKTKTFADNDTLKTVTDFNPWSIVINNKISGFVIPFGEETLICTFALGSNGNVNLRNTKRFGINGVYIRGELSPNALPSTVDDSEHKYDNKDDKKDDNKEDKKDDNKEDKKSEDYLLKTQIVPPVCPTCPSCPGNVACTNCGGKGGSGTLTSRGESIVDETPSARDEKRRGGIIRKVVSDTTGLARDAVSGADDLVRDAASGTAGLAKDAVGGTVGIAKDAVGGTVGLAKDAVSGAAGLLTGAASGVAGLFKANPMQMQQSSINPYMQANSGRRPRGGAMPQTVDNTNYFGALPERQSTNYMPITADFSAFSR